MMTMRIAGALLLVGCADPAAEQTYDDVAALVGATIATGDGGATMGAVSDSSLLARGDMPAGFAFENDMIFGDHGALAHQYSMIACRDEGWVIQPCNPLTDTATMLASWSGSIDGPDLAVTSRRQGMWTLRNLQTWMPAITGSSNLETEGSVGGRAYELTASESEAMITPNLMMGGSIHLDLNIAGDELAIGADLVFDNLRSDASLTLDEEHAYRVDLRSGHVEPQ